MKYGVYFLCCLKLAEERARAVFTYTSKYAVVQDSVFMGINKRDVKQRGRTQLCRLGCMWW